MSITQYDIAGANNIDLKPRYCWFQLCFVCILSNWWDRDKLMTFLISPLWWKHVSTKDTEGISSEGQWHIGLNWFKLDENKLLLELVLKTTCYSLIACGFNLWE